MGDATRVREKCLRVVVDVTSLMNMISYLSQITSGTRGTSAEGVDRRKASPIAAARPRPHCQSVWDARQQSGVVVGAALQTHRRLASANIGRYVRPHLAQPSTLCGPKGRAHCLTRSDVTSVERGVRMSQCGQAPLGMRIEGVGDSHFS